MSTPLTGCVIQYKSSCELSCMPDGWPCLAETCHWLYMKAFILCDCGAVAHIRFRHLGRIFMEPCNYKVLHFIRGVGLIKG
jgi:hypothetical protein